MTRRRSVAGLAAAVAAALVLSACGGSGGAQSNGTAGGSFVVFLSEPEHLVPTNTNESEGSQVLSALFTGLVDYDPETSQPQNAMAESVTSTDNLNWTVKIKSGWTFHNGETVTAQSYVDAWNFGSLSTNAQDNSSFFDKIAGWDDLQGDAEKKTAPKATAMSGLKVVDETTFTVKLAAPFSQFPLMLGYTAFYPMPKAALTDVAKYEKAPIGNGPYQMDGEWQHDEYIKVKRFEGYRGKPGKADSIEFRIYKDVNTAYTDLKGGNVDIMDSVPPEKIGDARREFGDRFLERESSSYTYLGFPLYDRRFANKKLRQALSMAINREQITEKIFSGTRAPAYSVMSPVVAGSRKDACKYCKYDPEQAKKLFAEAGGWTGTMTMWFNSGAGHDKWVEAVSNQWKNALGIKDVKFQSLDFAQYLPKRDAHEMTGPFRSGWIMDYPSPQNFLEPIYGSRGSSNDFGYTSPAFDTLIDEGNRAKSVAAGIAKYQAAEDIILEDLPAIPMFFGRVTGAHSDNVTDVVIDAFGRVRVADVVVRG